MAQTYQQGQIVLFANVPDQGGGNHKDRPVVLVDDFDPVTDEFAFGVAITGEFTLQLPPTSIALPFHRKGSNSRCKTGLTKDSVAVCTWVVHAKATGILAVIGSTPATQLEQILDQLEELYG